MHYRERRPPKKLGPVREALPDLSNALRRCLLTGLGTLAFNECNAGSNPVTVTGKVNMKLEIIDDEVKWVERDGEVVMTNVLEVFRPTEQQARKLYKQLKELFEK